MSSSTAAAPTAATASSAAAAAPRVGRRRRRRRLLVAAASARQTAIVLCQRIKVVVHLLFLASTQVHASKVGQTCAVAAHGRPWRVVAKKACSIRRVVRTVPRHAARKQQCNPHAQRCVTHAHAATLHSSVHTLASCLHASASYSAFYSQSIMLPPHPYFDTGYKPRKISGAFFCHHSVNG